MVVLLLLFLLLLLILVLWVLFFLNLVVLVVTTVDAGSVWDIAFFDPKEVYLGVFWCLGHRLPGRRLPSKMPVNNTDNNYNVKTVWAKASLSVCVRVLRWDDERRLPAVRLKTSSTRTRSYVTWPGKKRKRVTRSLAKRRCCQEGCGRSGGITY